MAENREEILANFQGISGIDDVAVAIMHLEESNWDLISAVNKVVQDPTTSTATNTEEVQMIVDDDDENDMSVIIPKTRPPDLEDSQASTSSIRNNINSNSVLHMQVLFNRKIHDLQLPTTATVNDLKKKLETTFNVPICRQQIFGLGGPQVVPAATLESLNLPYKALIRLKEVEEPTADDEITQRLAQTYTLRVKHDNKEFMLNFPGTKTVQEVKNDIYSFTDIPVRHQDWTGWPNVSGLDETVLAMVGLDLPHHDLTVKRSNKHKEYKRIVVESSDSDSSVEEIEDSPEGFVGDDDMFVDIERSDRLQPLLSDNVEDEAIGCIEFSQRFRSRYGPNTPNFFEGTLQDAIKEACFKPASERKLLGIYLHHEKSVLSNVFCAQLLGCETVLQTLNANFIVYGWDMTHHNNANTFLASVTNSLGYMASMTIRNIQVEQLPALVIIMRVRSNNIIYSVINGNVGVSDMVAILMEAVERYSQQRGEDARAEQEREARQRVKWEQDQAYQQSLEADRAKEQIKKQQELERTQEIERAENERLVEEAKEQELRTLAAARVPLEPLPCASDVTRVRVRLPPPHDHHHDQPPLERRFLVSDTLQALFDFIASKGFPQEKYKVIASWPRRDLTTESHTSTFKALKLFPQETVMLEER